RNVKIRCLKHGIFEQTPTSHIDARTGCPKCARKRITEANRYTIAEFLQKARAKHGDRYGNGDILYVNGRTNVTIICKKHGPFEQTPASHIRQRSGCPICDSSHGEIAVANYLKEMGIGFKRQARLIPNRRRFAFDFHLSESKVLIEFHGRQHYLPVE